MGWGGEGRGGERWVVDVAAGGVVVVIAVAVGGGGGQGIGGGGHGSW